jgi:FlaA1/EpsC-like NDP-sugar epimerase
VTGATGTVGSEIVKQVASISPSPSFITLGQLFIHKIGDTEKQFDNKELKLLIWIILSQKV